MRYLFHYSLSYLFLFPIAAFAQGTESTPPGATYKLMAPLAGYLTGEVNLTQYLQGVVQVTIGIAGILAVIMIVVCGIKLMGTPSASARSEAKECVWNAIFGVLLAAGAWVILNTINPLLLSNELNLANVTVSPPASTAGGTSNTGTPAGPTTDPMPIKPGWYFKYSDNNGSIHYNPAGNSAQVCAELIDPAKAAGKSVLSLDDGRICFEVLSPSTSIAQDEASTRNALCGNDSCVGSTPIGINNRPCPTVGSRGCTNVGGLPSSAIDFIKGLQSACGCNVVITGGTEYWLHKTHAAGKPIFDLRLKEGGTLTGATKYILANATGKRSSFTNYRVFLNNFWLTDEGDHWHVCELGQNYWFCKNCTDKSCKTEVAPQ